MFSRKVAKTQRRISIISQIINFATSAPLREVSIVYVLFRQPLQTVRRIKTKPVFKGSCYVSCRFESLRYCYDCSNGYCVVLNYKKHFEQQNNRYSFFRTVINTTGIDRNSGRPGVQQIATGYAFF